jgi:hypothetical protein
MATAPAIRHLEEQQKRQLPHIIAVGQTVIAQNVANNSKAFERVEAPGYS